MRLRFTLISIVFGLLLIGCGKGNEDVRDNTEPHKYKDELTVTESALNITEWSVEITCYANPSPEMGNVTMGVILSTDASPSLENGMEFTSKELDKNNRYIIYAKNLSSNTTYYYKSFVQYGGIYRYGEVKSFTTLEIQASITAVEAICDANNIATMMASISVSTVAELPITTWFVMAEGTHSKEELLSIGTIVEAKTTSGNKQMECNTTCLVYNQSYSYLACIEIYDITIFSEVSSFSSLEATIGCSVSNISPTCATFNVSGNYLDQNSIVALYYSSTYSSQSDLIQKGTKTFIKGNGDDYSLTIKNLRNDRRYYYVAVASLEDQEIYSQVSSFKTEAGASQKWLSLSQLSITETFESSGVLYYMIRDKVYVSQVQFNPWSKASTDKYISVEFLSDDNPSFFAYYMTYQGYVNWTLDGVKEERVQHDEPYLIDFSPIQSNVYIKGYQRNAQTAAVNVLVVE